MTRRTVVAERAGKVPVSSARPATNAGFADQSATEVGNLAIQDLIVGRLFAKLKVGGASDPEEREADALANTVMAGGGPCSCRGSCPKCSGGSGEGVLRRKADYPGGAAPPSVRRAFNGSGRPLDSATRQRFEPQFGTSLSHIRLHDDTRTASMAATIGARAFAAGNDIGFARGELSPESDAGRRLLAHELSHVVLRHGGVRRGGAGDAMILARNRELEEKRQRVEALNRQLSGTNSPPVNGGQGARSASRENRGNAGPVNANNREIGPPRAPAPGESTEFRGKLLYPDPFYLYDLLAEMVTSQGTSATADFVESFYLDVILPKRPAAGISEDPNVWRDEAVYSALDEQLQKLSSDVAAFVAQFEAEARAAAHDFLNENEKHVRAEAIAYGVTLAVSMSDEGTVEIGGDTTENAATRGLAIAAQGLIERKRKADKTHAAYMEFTSGVPAIAELGSQRYWKGDKPELEEKRRAMDDAQSDLDVTRAQLQLQFPILAALSSDGDFKWDELGDLAKGKAAKSSEATKVIIDQIVEKLENIQKVRKELEPGGDVNIWLVPQIIEPLRDTFSAGPGSLNGRVVDEKIEDEKPSWITGILIGLAQLGLVLLAPVTGGLTLIPAAAISVGTAYEHIKEYQLKKAMHGTDFGAAALSAEDPSLFWLAVDIIGAGLDVTAAGGAALKMFRQIAPLAKALRGARTAEEAVLLEKQVAQVGGQALGEKIAQTARGLREGATRELGISAQEARQFEETTSAFAKQELGAEVVETAAKGQAKVSRAGGIFVCSSPCTMIRERFKDILANDPELLKKLVTLEEGASKLPKGAEGDLGRQAFEREAQSLIKDLENSRITRMLETLGPERAAVAVSGHPQLVGDLAAAQALTGEAATAAMRDLLARADMLERAEGMSLKEIEALLDTAEYAKGSTAGKDLRYLRYTKQSQLAGSKPLPFDRWQSKAVQAWDNAELGSKTERELKAAYDLGPKNTKTMHAPPGQRSFIPDHVSGHPSDLVWGQSYDFVELKDWQSMSRTGNVDAMLDYVANTTFDNTSTLTLYFRSDTKMSGLLMKKIETLQQSGRVKLIPFISR